MLAGPHPRSLSRGDFAPRSGRRRFSCYVSRLRSPSNAAPVHSPGIPPTHRNCPSGGPPGTVFFRREHAASHRPGRLHLRRLRLRRARAALAAGVVDRWADRSSRPDAITVARAGNCRCGPAARVLFWFVVVVSTLRQLTGAPRIWQLDVLLAWLAFSFPPLIMHIWSCEVAAERATAPSTPSRALIWLMYTRDARNHGVEPPRVRGCDPLAAELAARTLGVGITLGFIFAAVYSIALVGRAPHKKETAREEQSRRWHLALFGFVVVVFGFLVALAFRNEASPSAIAMGVLRISARSLPLPFLFVAAYFEHRFEFFDLFVKGGLSLLLTIAVLTGAFALLLPFFQSVHASPAAPWIYEVILLPVVTALPWLYGRVSATLDRWWLGRRFTTVEAGHAFSGRVRSATSEDRLIERASRALPRFSTPRSECSFQPLRRLRPL